MAAISEYVHVIPTLEVYPRVYHFNRRYNDLLGKFNRLTDKYRNDLRGEQFTAEKNTLQNGLTIKVIGRDNLSPEDYLTVAPNQYQVQTYKIPNKDIHTDYIVAVDPYKDKLKSLSPPNQGGLTPVDFDVTTGVSQLKIDHPISPDTTVIICYANIQELSADGLKEVELLSKRLPNTKDFEFLLFCRCSEKYTKSDKDSFRGKLTHEIGSIFDHIVIGTKTGDEISQLLETKLAQSFVTLQSVLRRYTKKQTGQCEIKPLETDVVEGQISDFLNNSLGYSEVIHPVSENEKFSYTILRRLSRTIRCAVVNPLSDKYNIPVWLCNYIMMEDDFEQKLIGAISDSTQSSLDEQDATSKKQLDEKSIDRTELFQEKSSSILSSLQVELKDSVKCMGRKLNMFTKAVKKMLLEITACRKKMIVCTAQPEHQMQVGPKTVDDSLRKDILSMKNVYGVGTIYGQLEIHVNNEDDVKKVGEDINNLFRREKHFCPFVVRAVKSKPKKFVDSQLEHGGQIVCSTRTGTLGGFLDGSDNHLYGLTCAHVVEGSREEDVFINDGSGRQRVLFAKRVPNMIVSTGEDSKPLIDLAAVRVIDNMKDKCIKFLKDEDGKIKPAILPADTPIELVGTYVYKHGAITQCTKGLVCSDDYSVLNTDELTYIILIDKYDDDDNDDDDDDGDPFANRGDSGSMICSPYENEVHVVKAIGILSAGEFTREDQETPLYFSFRLYDGLRKLTTKAGGVQFSFPKDYD